MNFVEYQGLRTPPPGMVRHGGKSDEEHVASARMIVELARQHARLKAKSRTVDIGCGAGRFLIGMLSTFGKVNSYVGLDVRKPVVEWCRDVLAQPERGDIRFEWLNVKNDRYNAKLGNAIPAHEVSFPVETGSADVVVLFSVFSHMTSEDTLAYLKEINRILAPRGHCLCTTFVEEGVPDWEENPKGYHREWRRPLHCARFSRSHIEDLVHIAGLKLKKLFAGKDNPPQTVLILGKPTMWDWVIERQKRFVKTIQRVGYSNSQIPRHPNRGASR